MSAPTVSTVIATRDRPEMLREAIDAVWSQDYDGAIEIIVVYDRCEPDRSLERVDDRRRVKVITNVRSPGLAGARNSGIEVAAGDVVAFCDDDDYWMPAKLRHQLRIMTAEPDVHVVTCGIRVDYAEESYDRRLPVDSVTFSDLLRDRHTELHPSTFLIRRDALFGELGLVDEGVPAGFGEDYEFLLRAAARTGPIRNVQESLVVVRWGQQSYFSRRWEDMTAGLSWLLERYPEFEKEPRGAARIHGQIAFAQAALKNRRSALRWARSAWRRNPREPRAALAAAVAVGVISPDTVMERLHRHGRGI